MITGWQNDVLFIELWLCLCLITSLNACDMGLIPLYDEGNKRYIRCDKWNAICPLNTECQIVSNRLKHQMGLDHRQPMYLCCMRIRQVSKYGRIDTVDNIHSNSTELQSSINRLQLQATPAPIHPQTLMPQIFNTTMASIVSSASTPSSQVISSSVIGRPTPAALPRIAIITPPPKVAPPPSIPETPSLPAPFIPARSFPKMDGLGFSGVNGTKLLPLLQGVNSPKRGKVGEFLWSGSVTLIQDDGYNILVDTGSAMSRVHLLAALASKGIAPQNIHILILTHAHPDHTGNEALFPQALKIYDKYIYKANQWIEPDDLKKPIVRLTNNVEMWKTPGHTIQHSSIIVRNLPILRDTVISGDLFLNSEDFRNPDQWRRWSVDVALQEQTRDLIICQVDVVVPGHGPMFSIGSDLKTIAGCNS